MVIQTQAWLMQSKWTLVKLFQTEFKCPPVLSKNCHFIETSEYWFLHNPNTEKLLKFFFVVVVFFPVTTAFLLPSFFFYMQIWKWCKCPFCHHRRLKIKQSQKRHKPKDVSCFTLFLASLHWKAIRWIAKDALNTLAKSLSIMWREFFLSVGMA